MTSTPSIAGKGNNPFINGCDNHNVGTDSSSSHTRDLNNAAFCGLGRPPVKPKTEKKENQPASPPPLPRQPPPKTRRMQILAGPGGAFFDNTLPKTMAHNIDATGRSCTVFTPTGRSGVVDKYLDALVRAPSDRPSSLVLANGGIVNGQHYLNLDGFRASTRKLFDRIENTVGRPVDLILTASQGAEALKDAYRLPAGSSVVVLAPGNEWVSKGDVEAFAAKMASAKSLDAKRLLLTYCTTLTHRNAPSFWSNGKTYSLDSMLKSCLGKQVPEKARQHAHKSLGHLLPKDRIEEVIDKMEKANRECPILTADYGVALAIVGALFLPAAKSMSSAAEDSSTVSPGGTQSTPGSQPAQDQSPRKVTSRMQIFSGPGGTAFGPALAKTMTRNIGATGRSCEVFQHSCGSGVASKYLDALARDTSDRPSSLVIANGGVENGQHCLNLEGFWTSTGQLFDRIENTVRRPVDLILTAYQGAEALKDAHRLPAGSSLAVLAPGNEKVSMGDVEAFAAKMASAKSLDAKRLLLTYCTTLTHRNAPSFWSNGKTYSLDSMLKSCLGKQVPEKAKQYVQDSLGHLLAKDRIEEVIKEMEQANRERPISTENYGVALAVVGALFLPAAKSVEASPDKSDMSSAIGGNSTVIAGGR